MSLAAPGMLGFKLRINFLWMSGVIVVQLLSCVWLFATPWAVARQAPLSFTVSRSLLRLVSTESVASGLTLLCRRHQAWDHVGIMVLLAPASRPSSPVHVRCVCACFQGESVVLFLERKKAGTWMWNEGIPGKDEADCNGNVLVTNSLSPILINMWLVISIWRKNVVPAHF